MISWEATASPQGSQHGPPKEINTPPFTLSVLRSSQGSLGRQDKYRKVESQNGLGISVGS